MEVIEFNSQVRIAQPFTNDVAALERAIRQSTVNGSTSLYNAIYVSLNELKKERARSAEEIRRQAIVVLSDGDDTSSLVEYDVVLEMAKRSETAIYAIGLRQAEIGRPKFREAEFVLRQLSQETGGRVFFPTNVAELPKIYEQISEELASQYSIALFLEEPDAQRRLAAGGRAHQQAGTGRARAARLLRPDLDPNARRHAPAAAPAVRRRRGRVHRALRVARSPGRAAGDRDPRQRRPRPHVPHRHADGPGRARAARRHDRARSPPSSGCSACRISTSS